MEVTVKLPKSLYKDVSQIALAKKKSIAEIITNAVRKEIAEETETLERPLADCSDEEVLALANLKMPKEQSDRQSELLYKNQAGKLTPIERNELNALMNVYQMDNLRKAQGIYEAVLRNLIKTPDDLE